MATLLVVRKSQLCETRTNVSANGLEFWESLTGRFPMPRESRILALTISPVDRRAAKLTCTALGWAQRFPRASRRGFG